MKRGDVVIVSAPGDFGKPRPAVVIQSDIFDQEGVTVVLCLVTSFLQDTSLYRLEAQQARAAQGHGAQAKAALGL